MRRLHPRAEKCDCPCVGTHLHTTHISKPSTEKNNYNQRILIHTQCVAHRGSYHADLREQVRVNLFRRQCFCRKETGHLTVSCDIGIMKSFCNSHVQLQILRIVWRTPVIDTPRGGRRWSVTPHLLQTRKGMALPTSMRQSRVSWSKELRKNHIRSALSYRSQRKGCPSISPVTDKDVSQFKRFCRSPERQCPTRD
jgi:hypothetical protein